MSSTDLTFKESVRLIDICAREIDAYAELLGNNPPLQQRMRQVADVIADKSAQMKLDRQWSDYHRQHKTAPTGTAITS